MTWTIVRSCNFLIFFSVRLCEGSNYLCFPLMSDILMTQSAVVLSQSTVRNYLKGLIDFSGCPAPQRGALGAGYDVPGWRVRRLVFDMTVKSQNRCLLSISNPRTNGYEACAHLCSQTSNCLGWTQKLANNLCYLKTRSDYKNGDQNWIHGLPCSTGVFSFIQLLF